MHCSASSCDDALEMVGMWLAEKEWIPAFGGMTILGFGADSPVDWWQTGRILIWWGLWVLGASPVPINWHQIKEFAQDVQEPRQDSLKYGQ